MSSKYAKTPATGCTDLFEMFGVPYNVATDGGAVSAPNDPASPEPCGEDRPAKAPDNSPSTAPAADESATEGNEAHPDAAPGPEPEEAPASEDTLSPEARAIALSPWILDLVAKVLRAAGLVGEERAAKLVFLAVVSRVLQMPVSLVIKGPSSAGKSNLVKQVLKLFPKRAYHSMTTMSPKALIHSKEPLDHRCLFVAEAIGVADEEANYLLRSLLSDGAISHETVEATSEGLIPRRIEREGPTGLITTTTSPSLHAENETRLLSVPIDDSPEQTRKILMAMGKSRKAVVDFAPWHELNSWLQTAESRVNIPFAAVLGSLVSTGATRMRRDYEALLNLISAHAILHQQQRERDEDGWIIAELEDYEAVHPLVSDLMAQAVELAAPSTVVETVEAVRFLLAEKARRCGDADVWVTQTELMVHLQRDKSTVSRRVAQAMKFGYLRDLNSAGGAQTRVHRIVLGDDLPEDAHVLPTPERLMEEWSQDVSPDDDGDPWSEALPGGSYDAAFWEDDDDPSAWR